MTEFFDELTRDATEAGLPFLLVGGHAVNAYGYQRTTVDADLLVPESALRAWRTYWETRGYECIHATDAFCQFQAPRTTEGFPVDLMVVASETFERLCSRKQRLAVGSAELDVPHPLHLIALKLHALRTESRSQKGKDLQDILGLIRSCELDIRDVEFQEMLDRYADETTRAQIEREIQAD